MRRLLELSTVLPLFLAACAAAPSAGVTAERPPAGLAARMSVTPGFAMARPQDVGLPVEAVDALVAGARAADSASLVLICDGRAIAFEEFREPNTAFKLASVTKPIAAMAVGLLIDEGKIASVDAPLATWYPGWRTGPKASVTLRHVLTHTSGLRRAAEGDGGFPPNLPDLTAWAAEQPLDAPPGTRWEYNNQAYQLLAGVVREAAGEPLDAYVARRVFAKLGITEWIWRRDQAGNTKVFGGLALRPLDLAKLGWLLADGGRWRGEQVLPGAWLAAATASATPVKPTMGLSWFLLARGGVQYGFEHSGSFGQYLMVSPKARIALVRQVEFLANGEDPEARNFGEIYQHFRALVEARIGR